MFNKIFAACASIALAVSPVNARVEDGTSSLINLMDANGIPVLVNAAECDSDEFLGLYIHRGLQRRMVLCPGDTVDATDHAVVRHEAWHAIQHCVNAARGTHSLTPIQEDTVELMSFVNEYLTPQQIAGVQSLYPKEHWLMELEAFTAMEALTATEIVELFKMACILQG